MIQFFNDIVSMVSLYRDRMIVLKKVTIPWTDLPFPTTDYPEASACLWLSFREVERLVDEGWSLDKVTLTKQGVVISFLKTVNPVTAYRLRSQY